jgi:hypothetical protein
LPEAVGGLLNTPPEDIEERFARSWLVEREKLLPPWREPVLTPVLLWPPRLTHHYAPAGLVQREPSRVPPPSTPLYASARRAAQGPRVAPCLPAAGLALLEAWATRAQPLLMSTPADAHFVLSSRSDGGAADEIPGSGPLIGRVERMDAQSPGGSPGDRFVAPVEGADFAAAQLSQKGLDKFLGKLGQKPGRK